MQLQHREVRVKNDDYKREQQRLAKQIKRVVVLKDDHIFAFCAVWNTLTFSNSFNVMRTFCLPSHTFHTSLRMHDRLSQKHVPSLLIQTCWFKGHGDAREAYTANAYT